jgi:hypothetical protein
MLTLKRTWLLIAIPILVILAALLAVRIVGSIDYHHNDNDFFTFWLAGHLVAQAGNPYDITQWLAGYHQFDIGFIPNHPIFLYPLPLALLLAPLGFIPFHSAYVAWVTLTQLMIIASLTILLSLETNPRTKLFFIPLFAGIVLFRPTLLTLIQGQVSGLFLFALVWVAFLWQKGKWFWGGFLLGLLALKPNLGVIVIILLTIWLLLQKYWKALYGMLVSGVFLLIAGLIYNPGWVAQYWHVGSNKFAEASGSYPTVWELGALIGHNATPATLIIGGLAALLILFGFFWTILRSRAALPPVSVLALAITVTLLVTPYTWTYDQLLLIFPIIVLTLALDRTGVRFLLPAAIFLGIDVLVVVLLYYDTLLQGEVLNVVVPLVVFGLCLWRFYRRIPANTRESDF